MPLLETGGGMDGLGRGSHNLIARTRGYARGPYVMITRLAFRDVLRECVGG